MIDKGLGNLDKSKARRKLMVVGSIRTSQKLWGDNILFATRTFYA